jgi:SAM-dependent methyltransferase
MAKGTYIHGTRETEQSRLAKLNALTNPPFVAFLDCERAARILEVGSGLGLLSRDVCREATSAHVFGIEYSAAQLGRAQPTDRLHFIQADAHAIPFVGESFDIAYCRYVLEHVSKPVDVLRQMHRVLRTGGKAYAQENNILMCVFDPECPAFDSIWKRFAVLQEKLGGDALIGKRLFRYFRQAGFVEIELSYQPEIHHSGSSHFQLWVENLIGNIRSGEEALQNHGLANVPEIEAAVGELTALMERPDASALFYWNRASGIKP